MSTPVADMAPIPGSPSGIRRHASRYTRTAIAIGDAIAMLQAVADASEEERSEAVEALSGAIGDTRARLTQIRDRYEVAGSALATFADELEGAQTDAAAAIAHRDDAVRRQAYNRGHLDEARTAARSTVDPAELADATDAVRRYSSLTAAAASDLSAAQTAHAGALQRVADAGDTAAGLIAQAVGSDGVNDSGWDNFLDWVNDNSGWLSVVKDVLSVVTMVIGALSIFFPVLAPIALGLAAVTAGLSFILAASGSGSWLDFGLDMLGVLTFGVGTAAIGAIKLGGIALRGTRAARLAVTSPRAVFGGSLREVGSNLLERGLVGTARRPLDMVRREAASVVPNRPGLADVLRRPEAPWLNEIRETGHVFTAEFNRIAQQARLGAGGMIDDAIIGMTDGLARVHRATAVLGTGLDVYNGVGIGVNRVMDPVAAALGASPIGDIVSAGVDLWNAPGAAATNGLVDWQVR